MTKDTRRWVVEAAVTVSDGTDFETSRPFGIGLLLANARVRGIEVDLDTLTHHQNPMFPGDLTRRVWKAKEAR